MDHAWPLAILSLGGLGALALVAFGQRILTFWGKLRSKGELYFDYVNNCWIDPKAK